MISKQEKLRYGEILRQQIREKEQMKKQARRGHNRVEEPIVQNRPATIEKENNSNSYQRPLDPKEQLQRQFETQEYAYLGGIRGENAQYNKGSSQHRTNVTNTNHRNLSQPNNLRMPAEELMEFSGNQNQNQIQGSYRQNPERQKTQQESYQYGQDQSYGMQQQSISPNSLNHQSYPQNQSQPRQYAFQKQYRQQPYNNNYEQRQHYEQRSYAPQQINDQYAQNPTQIVSHEYIPSGNSRLQQPPPRQQYQPSAYQPSVYQQQSPQQSYGSNQNSYGNSYESHPYVPPSNNTYGQYGSQNPQPQSNNTNLQTNSYGNNNQSNPNLHSGYEQRQEPDDQTQDIYRKGGRNLLKLQNETADEHLVKQRRKMEIQKQLQQQIEEANRKKQEEKERLKREEEEEQRKHREYLAEQKRKIDEEERKKKEDKQRIIDENLKNLENKKKMQQEAKDKAKQEQFLREEKQRQQQQQQQSQRLERQKRTQQQQHQQQFNHNHAASQQQPHQHHVQGSLNSENTSVISSSDTSQIERGFDTAMSKEFFAKQRQKQKNFGKDRKIEEFTSQIQKMKNEIINQRQMLQDQIQSVRDQAERAQIDKKKADEEIQRLKRELQKKLNDDNEALLRALQKNDYQNDSGYHRVPAQKQKQKQQYQDTVYEEEENYPSFQKKTALKQKKNEQLVERKFEPMDYNKSIDDNNEFMASGLMSLDGDSKKIPLYLENTDKLTLSQVEDFAKDSAFFQKGFRNSPKRVKNHSPINESIAEVVEEERDFESRKSNRGQKSRIRQEPKDELDRMIDSREKSRGGWGEMSSVNSDITKEIEDLLRKKQNPGTNKRPNSISNAGKQSLQRQAFEYDGMTLNSNAGVGTLGTGGTIDLDGINGKNEARLAQLRNLGVETINTTNGDQDLNELDRLLSKYK